MVTGKSKSVGATLVWPKKDFGLRSFANDKTPVALKKGIK